MDRAQKLFNTLMRFSAKIGDNTYEATTAKRNMLVIPKGVKILDTDLNTYFIGDGSTYGGVSIDARDNVRTITAVAASVFTLSDTFKTIASASSGVFTSNTHGFSVGTVIKVAGSTNTTYKLTQDATYTVATVPTANTFTLTGVTPDDATANLVVKLYSTSNNNYMTWPQAAYLRTGDAITFATGGGTLPSGLTAAAYYIVKDDTTANGGREKNVSTKFRVSDTKAHALAGTDIITIRTAGAGSPTAVTTSVDAMTNDETIFISNAVAVSLFLPAGASTNTGRRYEIVGLGSAAATVKTLGGTINGVAAGTGVILKASSLDFISVVSDGTNYHATSKQITS